MINKTTTSPYAPIVLFVYNRLDHTRQTVESLKSNYLAEKSDLFIFSDAANNNEVMREVREVRKYIRTVKGFNTVNIIERKENLGLAKSIIDGVTSTCEKYGKVIVLEDDLETSPYFLSYMNDALTLYSDEKKVMHISGCTYPIKDFCHESSYFLNLPLCWGWATWDRAWSAFSNKINIMEEFNPDMISKLNFDNTYNYWGQLELNRRGEMNTWFIFWYVTLFLSNGLSLFPNKSLVKNIGMDGTGVHCNRTNDFDHDEIQIGPVELSRIPLKISEDAFAEHKNYFRSIKPNLFSRLIRKTLLVIRGEK